MPDRTTNYKLIKPKEDEFYDVNQFNTNADTIDKTLGDLNSRVNGQLIKPGTGKQGNVPMFDKDRNLVDSGQAMTEKAERAVVFKVTAKAASWAGNKYTITDKRIVGDNPPGDVGPATGAPKEQMVAWRAAEMALELAKDGKIVLRADGDIPLIDIGLQVEVRS